MQSFKDVGGLIAKLLRAGSTNSDDAGRDQLSVLIFEVGDRSFAINVENTEGVVYCGRVSPLPGAPDGVTGVTSVKGRITLVVDLNGDSIGGPDTKRLILLKGESQFGFRADKVDTVIGLDPESVNRESLAEIPERMRETLSGVGLIERGSFEFQGREVPVIDEVIPERD